MLAMGAIECAIRCPGFPLSSQLSFPAPAGSVAHIIRTAGIRADDLARLSQLGKRRAVGFSAIERRQPEVGREGVDIVQRRWDRRRHRRWQSFDRGRHQALRRS